MHGTGWKIVAKKQRADGQELWLALEENGERILLLPRAAGKEKVRLENLKRLREIAESSAALSADGLVTLRAVRPWEDRLLLELAFDQALWDNWEDGPPQRLDPAQTLAFLKRCAGIMAAFRESGLAAPAIHPTDLLALGTRGLGVLDPRVGAVLEDVDPVRPPRSLCLPPEVIRGKPQSVKSALYSAGLTAYVLLTGVFPFQADRGSEAVDSVLKETPLDVRVYAPETSGRLAELIRSLLEKDPGDRPAMEQVTETISRLEPADALASPAEQEENRDKAEWLVRRRERWRKFRRWWRAGRWAVAAVVLAGLLVLLAKPGYKPQLTKDTPPEKVVDQFYSAFAGLDVLRLDETLYKTGRDIDWLVTMAFIQSRYVPDGTVRKVLFLKNLKVAVVRKTGTSAQFSAAYTLEMINGAEKRIQERRDFLILRPVKGIWRIVKLRSAIVKERVTKDVKALRERVDKHPALR